MLKRQLFALLCLSVLCSPDYPAQDKTTGGRAAARQSRGVPDDLMLRILRLEDERNLNGEELLNMLAHASPAVRARAALALGRIGDKRATEALLSALVQDEDVSVNIMSAFALGEIEDSLAITTLVGLLESPKDPLLVRARIVEALGKIASLPAGDRKTSQPSPETVNAVIIRQLPDTKARLSPGQKLMTSLAITALLRLRLPASVAPLTQQLRSTDAGIRAQAANALYRLRQPMPESVPVLLEALEDKDTDVRASAVRALGQIGDLRDVDAIRSIYQLYSDPHEHVRTNAARALTTLAGAGNRLALETLVAWSQAQTKTPVGRRVITATELEIAAALGSLRDKRFLDYLSQLRAADRDNRQPEIETAIARIDEKTFLADLPPTEALIKARWQQAAAIAQGLGEISGAQGQERLRAMLQLTEEAKLDERAVPAILVALAKHKPQDLPELLRARLLHKDVHIRAAAAGLLSTSLTDENRAALISAMALARQDSASDAKLALLMALSKYDDEKARLAIRAALDDDDHLVRRQAAALLQQKGSGRDSESRPGIVRTKHDDDFYRRVLRRAGTTPVAVIQTKRGNITLRLFAADAPLTVDNFITLARSGYFNGITFHRVVPNFVIQGGDPRGDGEGGPGHQIRCEINLQPYQRGTVGMALSGKDTGGSQFFITHSPQPHLDGGYTVFGQVTAGMAVVDQIRRGEMIEKVTIREAARR